MTPPSTAAVIRAALRPGQHVTKPTPIPDAPNVVLFPQFAGTYGPEPRCIQTHPSPCPVCQTKLTLWWDRLTGQLQNGITCHGCGYILDADPGPASG